MYTKVHFQIQITFMLHAYGCSICVCGGVGSVREREKRGRERACMVTYALQKFTCGDDYESVWGRSHRQVTQSI